MAPSLPVSSFKAVKPLRDNLLDPDHSNSAVHDARIRAFTGPTPKSIAIRAPKHAHAPFPAPAEDRRAELEGNSKGARDRGSGSIAISCRAPHLQHADAHAHTHLGLQLVERQQWAAHARAKSSKSGNGGHAQAPFRFLAGVVFVCLSEFILVHETSSFFRWFTVSFGVLMTMRFIDYRSRQWLYFLIDYCYFIQALLLFNIYCMPRSPLLFQTLFVCINGPLAIAIPSCRNSLVFHDIEKMTTLFVHAFPPLVTFCLRWFTPAGFAVESAAGDGGWLSFHAAIVLPVAVYCAWQGLYLLKTEVLDRAKLERDPSIMTSFRLHAFDSRTRVGRVCLSHAAKGAGAMNTAFMSIQFSYTVLCIIPGFLFFRFYYLHLLFLLSMLALGAWNGALFYLGTPKDRKKPNQKTKLTKVASQGDSACARDTNVNTRGTRARADAKGDPERLLYEKFFELCAEAGVAVFEALFLGDARAPADVDGVDPVPVPRPHDRECGANWRLQPPVASSLRGRGILQHLQTRAA